MSRYFQFCKDANSAQVDSLRYVMPVRRNQSQLILATRKVTATRACLSGPDLSLIDPANMAPIPPSYQPGSMARADRDLHGRFHCSLCMVYWNATTRSENYSQEATPPSTEDGMQYAAILNCWPVPCLQADTGVEETCS
ncbi:uncharacterized protein LOC118408673 [Branchiostoma floridae]|uniref:Uncharacterized protein LOC118408673 n=1 Tax=Branchiostoma floridae TaxID=7739 RepID=A0A9J7KIS9_BRAFL|nr:uncharacterized protein LOC118408673 [Branchiostoma floridae]